MCLLCKIVRKRLKVKRSQSPRFILNDYLINFSMFFGLSNPRGYSFLVAYECAGGK